MTLKNYTTSISVEKTIMEIEKILTSNGATDILKKYDSDGNMNALMFRINVDGTYYPFKLPMQRDKIQEIFRKAYNKGKLQKKYVTDLEQASRTGWRIIKDWISSQMALIQIDLVKFEEVFLPYMYDEKNDETFFNKIEKGGIDKFIGYDK